MVDEAGLCVAGDEDPLKDTSFRRTGVELPSGIRPDGQRQTRLFLEQAAHVSSRLVPSFCSSHFLWRERQVRQPVLFLDFLGRSCKCKGTAGEESKRMFK